MSTERCAGVWESKSISPKVDGFYFLKQSAHKRWFDVENGWEGSDFDFEWLDESPIAIARATQSELVKSQAEESKLLRKACVAVRKVLATKYNAKEVALIEQALAKGEADATRT